ncbi:MAG: hypothetical protein Kow0029_01570 [Candidatus Rifleibacteriota bacterium]
MVMVFSMPGKAEFDVTPYLSDNTASFSNDIFYPEYFKQTDEITIGNLINEFKNRYEFFFGIGADQRHRQCFRLQDRINKWLKREKKQKGFVTYKWLDDEIIFNEESPLQQQIRPKPRKVDDCCSYVSFGKLGEDGAVFCKYHGPDPQSEFYQNHIHRFTALRPLITAYDITEILIFIPFIMVIPVSWFIMKKVLGTGSK